MSESSEAPIPIPSSSTSLGHATVTIGAVSWTLYIFGVTRIGRDLFIQMTLVGPRECTVTIRTRAVERGVTARQILDAVCDWLLSADPADRAFLELGSCAGDAERRSA